MALCLQLAECASFHWLRACNGTYWSRQKYTHTHTHSMNKYVCKYIKPIVYGFYIKYMVCVLGNSFQK